MNIGISEMLLLLFVALLLFGSKAVPELGRRIGRFTGEIEKIKRELARNDDDDDGDGEEDFREVDEKLLVFLSSVMNTQDDLQGERIAVKSLLSHEKLFSLWRFEDAPADDELEASYLDKVRECHLFLLILGSTFSPAVCKEFEAAREAKKPILVFVKKDVIRAPEAVRFIESLTEFELRYKVFASDEDLRREVMRAAYHCVVKYYKHGLTRKTYLACLALLLVVEESEADIDSIMASYNPAGPIGMESFASLLRLEQRFVSTSRYRESSDSPADLIWSQWNDKYFKEEDFRSALRLAKELVRTDPKKLFFLLCLAWTYHSLGDKDEAIRMAYKGYKVLASKVILSEYEEALKSDLLRWARFWVTGEIELSGGWKIRPRRPGGRLLVETR